MKIMLRKNPFDKDMLEMYTRRPFTSFNGRTRYMYELIGTIHIDAVWNDHIIKPALDEDEEVVCDLSYTSEIWEMPHVA